MFTKLFGSKKSSKAVDDELSQLEEKDGKVSSTSTTTTTTTIACVPPGVNVSPFLKNYPLDSFISVRLSGEKFSDKASTLLPLVEHHVKCHVMYPIVQVVSTMTFRNKNQKTIEGELMLPMPEGATLIGYAMEINGKLVDAVPVEKEKAKEVFEAEVRSGNKVSMVEKVAQSNCFKTRLYPLPYDTDKTVQVKYQMMLSERVSTENGENGVVKGSAWVPMSFLDFAALRPSSKIEFTLNETSLQGYETQVQMGLAKSETEKTTEHLWSSKNAGSRAAYFALTKADLKENMTGFNLTVTKKTDSVNHILLACENGYFMTSIPVPNLTEKLKDMSRIGDKVQIVWDCSMSQSDSHAKNVKLLESILGAIGAKSLVLSTFSNSVIDTKEFSSVKDLVKHVKDELVYDGGSNMLLLDRDLISSKVDYCVAFTNGVHTFGHEITPMCNFAKPVYFVNSSSVVNASLLRHIATKSGGLYLNANELEEQELLDAIGKPVLSFATADFEDDELEEVYPNEPVSLKEGEVFKLFGKFKSSSGKSSVNVAVSFRYGSEIYHVQEITLPVDTTDHAEAAIVPLLWAQQKIESLSAFPHLFKDEIKKIGQDFRIVTDNTSLLVLETLDQYLKHDITPPASLPEVLKQYNELKQKERQSEQDREKEKLERVISMWLSRVQWHKTDFKLPEPQPVMMNDKSVASTFGGISQEGGCPPPPSMMRSSCCSAMPCAPPPPSSSSLSRSLCDELIPQQQCLSSEIEAECCCKESCMECDDEEEIAEVCKEEKKSKKKSSSGKKDKKEKAEPSQPKQVSGAIKIKPWTPDAGYCKVIAKASNPYKEYLKQRENYRDSPAFYLDVADLFLTELKDTTLGVRILSNISELELENIQLYRIVGYRLDQANELELAEWVFERVKKLSPGEPQSYRDLALVKERMGKYREAMELFNKVIVGKWDMRFDEIELTVATEMNHLLMKDKDLPIVDKRLIHHFDLDIRISMAWDTNDVDIDLHVQEPGPYGEHAYFGHNRTTMGGYVSRDFRQGYGPEEYMLKKAQKGTYKATTNYYASHQQSLTGGTTVLCTFFTNYMRENEQRQMLTIRLSSHAQDVVVCEIDIQ
ncbi:hypothetical protein FDP41_007132 [Naegleria fowleri]|uniref:VIT domain-containing protein n=1 Tax=Naegleria fowleri TaxID=5763 RepID=A0A6A5BJ61_NAEFO|nr:uncharacterized protein FDP41_007132 [Naegleria fowleri]KAF0973745.1 hypothetical protein FDP41_007132 [Naegleria fowleri]